MGQVEKSAAKAAERAMVAGPAALVATVTKAIFGEGA